MSPSQAYCDLRRMHNSEDRRAYLSKVLPTIDAIALADELKVAAERRLHVRPRRAQLIADVIGEVGVVAGNASIEALGRLADADALRELGRYTDALAAYDAAAELYLKAGDEVGWARTRIGFAGTCTYTGQVREALAGADRARDILAAHQLWVRLVPSPVD